MKTYFLSFVLVSFALTSLGALAQYEDPDFETSEQSPAFETLDTDGNGFISREEAGTLPCLAENFDQAESESEEGLSRSEFEQVVQAHCSSW